MVVAVTAAALPLASGHGGHAHMHRHEHAHHHETHDEDVEWSHDHDDHEDHAGTTHDGKALELSAANSTATWCRTRTCGSSNSTRRCAAAARSLHRSGTERSAPCPCRRNPPLPKLPQVPCVGDGLHWASSTSTRRRTCRSPSGTACFRPAFRRYTSSTRCSGAATSHTSARATSRSSRATWQRPVNLLNAHLMAPLRGRRCRTTACLSRAARRRS